MFHHGGEDLIYLGSADWMRRNLNRRIEVAFPVSNPKLKEEIFELMDIQWSDNVKAVELDQNLNNIRIQNDAPPVRAQLELYERVKRGVLGKRATLTPTSES